MTKEIVTLLSGLTLMVNAFQGDLTATATASAQRYITVGTGNCLPSRPQWVGEGRWASAQQCEDACTRAPACIGYDHDAGDWLQSPTCRVRFEKNAAAASPPPGSQFRFIAGKEGIGFTGFTGSRRRKAVGHCNQKNRQQYKNDYHYWGAGNCEPDRPQWYNAGSNPIASFEKCLDLCDVAETCIGFDYDEDGFGTDEGGTCRVRFEDLFNARTGLVHTASPPDGYTAGGHNGLNTIGFTGVSGPSSAKCFEKVSPIKLKLAWENCGSASEVLLTGDPASLTPGQKTTMKGEFRPIDASMVLSPRTSDGWTFSLDVASVPRPDIEILRGYVCGGSASESLSCDLHGFYLSVGSLTFDGLDFPASSSGVDVKLDVQLAVYRAMHLMPITMTATVWNDSGDIKLCMKITASLPVEEEEQGLLQTASLTSMNKNMSTTKERARRLATKIV